MPAGGDGQPKKDEQDRYADAVVESALDVQPLADVGRDTLIGDHRLAQRRVGRRQHGREDRDLEQGQAAEQHHTDPETEHDRQRQADQQQPLWDTETFLQHPEIGIRGIGEQHHRQRQFGQGPQTLGIHIQVEQIQPERAEHQAERGKDQGTIDRRAFQSAAHGAVDKHERRQNRQSFVHRFTFSIPGARCLPWGQTVRAIAAVQSAPRWPAQPPYRRPCRYVPAQRQRCRREVSGGPILLGDTLTNILHPARERRVGITHERDHGCVAQVETADIGLAEIGIQPTVARPRCSSSSAVRSTPSLPYGAS